VAWKVIELEIEKEKIDEKISRKMQQKILMHKSPHGKEDCSPHPQ